MASASSSSPPLLLPPSSRPPNSEPNPTDSLEPSPISALPFAASTWSHPETFHLIDIYREKWYTLNRGQLRARHWDEVAASLAARCRVVRPMKTSTQCRHKMEKLRKRYRSELASLNGAESRWPFFHRMDLIEKGPSAILRPISSSHLPPPPLAKPNLQSYNSNEDNYGDDDDEEENNHTKSIHHILHRNPITVALPALNYPQFRDQNPNPNPISSFHPNSTSSFNPNSTSSFNPNSNSSFNPNSNSSFNPNSIPSFNPNLRRPSGGFSNGEGDGGGKGIPKRKRTATVDLEKEDEEDAAMMGLAAAVRSIGEGLMRVEKMKIEMMREMERTRIEMEMKRTQMILETQREIADIIADAYSSRKKYKRMSSPDS